MRATCGERKILDFRDAANRKNSPRDKSKIAAGKTIAVPSTLPNLAASWAW